MFFNMYYTPLLFKIVLKISELLNTLTKDGIAFQIYFVIYRGGIARKWPKRDSDIPLVILPIVNLSRSSGGFRRLAWNQCTRSFQLEYVLLYMLLLDQSVMKQPSNYQHAELASGVLLTRLPMERLMHKIIRDSTYTRMHTHKSSCV